MAVASGVHTLIVRAAFRRATPGAYAIRLAGTRGATDDDRARQALRTLRAEYGRIGDIQAARPLVERALTLAERTRGAAASRRGDRATGSRANPAAGARVRQRGHALRAGVGRLRNSARRGPSRHRRRVDDAGRHLCLARAAGEGGSAGAARAAGHREGPGARASAGRLVPDHARQSARGCAGSRPRRGAPAPRPRHRRQDAGRRTARWRSC